MHDIQNFKISNLHDLGIFLVNSAYLIRTMSWTSQYEVGVTFCFLSANSQPGAELVRESGATFCIFLKKKPYCFKSSILFFNICAPIYYAEKKNRCLLSHPKILENYPFVLENLYFFLYVRPGFFFSHGGHPKGNFSGSTASASQV